MEKKIVISKNGPYLVSGNLPLGIEIAQVGAEREPEQWVQDKQYPAKERYALCRCGQSGNKPFCDNTHASAGFDGTEIASRQPYAEQAETLTGPGLDLMDAESLCSAARFCHPKGGVWNLVRQSGDPDARKIAIREACDCPSGRLVAYDKKTQKPIDIGCASALSLIEDPQVRASGPIWVKGGVVIESADGQLYEPRQRVTLCRCGKSTNKPFCTGSHIKARFNDGHASLQKSAREPKKKR